MNMKNKKNLVMGVVKRVLPFCLLAFLPLGVCAQEDIDIDEDDIIVPAEDGEEEIIEFPEAMTYDLDSLLNLYMSKTYLDEDNSCRMKDENPIFTNEEYIDRLSRLPNIMEMSYNEVVQKFIDRYAGRLLHAWSKQFLHANLRGGTGDLRRAFGTEVPAHH